MTPAAESPSNFPADFGPSLSEGVQGQVVVNLVLRDSPYFCSTSIHVPQDQLKEIYVCRFPSYVSCLLSAKAFYTGCWTEVVTHL